MNITARFDASVGSAPSGYAAAIQSAISYLDQEITNPINVTIAFGWGEVNGASLARGAVGESSSLGYDFSYSALRSGLAAAATSADDFAALGSLPATDPTAGSKFFVGTPEAQALGLAGAAGGLDGYVGLNSSLTYTFDSAHRAVAGAYDAIGALEHEITEVLGRVGDAGGVGSGGEFAPLDLFRYASPGVRQFAAGADYFSIDGHTLLQPFNDAANGGDVGDWASSVRGDSFGGASPGIEGAVSAVDLRLMDVLGFTVAGSTPRVLTPPVTIATAGQVIDGTAGADSLQGQGGPDTIRGFDGADTIDGGAGDDVVNGNQGDDIVHGGAGNDSVMGGQGADTLYGDAGTDTLSGNKGNDILYAGDQGALLYGGQGDDTLHGGAGDDTLSGDLGNDILFGGAGADRFLFGPGGGVDWVGDFKGAEGDRLVLPVGTHYTLTAYQGQVVVDLGNGDWIGLAGVAPTQFSADWILSG